MSFANVDAVTASYHRCRSSEGFVDTFYEHFLAKSEEVARKFEKTDFARQKLLLRESLLAMLLLNLNSADAREELERLPYVTVAGALTLACIFTSCGWMHCVKRSRSMTRNSRRNSGTSGGPRCGRGSSCWFPGTEPIG